MRATCATCRFWNGSDTADRSTCHRFPPRPIDKDIADTGLPITGSYDWCGEHQPKGPGVGEVVEMYCGKTREQWLEYVREKLAGSPLCDFASPERMVDDMFAAAAREEFKNDWTRSRKL